MILGRRTILQTLISLPASLLCAARPLASSSTSTEIWLLERGRLQLQPATFAHLMTLIRTLRY